MKELNLDENTRNKIIIIIVLMKGILYGPIAILNEGQPSGQMKILPILFSNEG